MSDLVGITAVMRAREGDMDLLIERLRECNLSRDERQFVEDRLMGRDSAKMRRGPKKKESSDARAQEIIIADAWLHQQRGWDKDEARHQEIADAIGRKPSTVRAALKARPTVMTRWTLKTMKVMAFSGCAIPKPDILENTDSGN